MRKEYIVFALLALTLGLCFYFHASVLVWLFVGGIVTLAFFTTLGSLLEYRDSLEDDDTDDDDQQGDYYWDDEEDNDL